MKTIPDSLSPREAWSHLSQVSQYEMIFHNVKQANGCVLAEDLLVPDDVPAGHRAFMDGYAVRANDTKSAPIDLHLAGEIAMGESPEGSIQSGQAMRIPTGGFLPQGSDAVVMQENTEQLENQIRILKSVNVWENVQVRGEDFRKGDVLFAAGHNLRPQDLAAIATFGIMQLKVFRKPAVHIFSTGNELLPYTESKIQNGMIRETNSLSLANSISKFGFE